MNKKLLLIQGARKINKSSNQIIKMHSMKQYTEIHLFRGNKQCWNKIHEPLAASHVSLIK